LNISDNDNSLALNLFLAMAANFRLNADETNEAINQAHNSVKGWRIYMGFLLLSRKE